MSTIQYQYAITESLKLVSIYDINNSNRLFSYLCPSCKNILRPRLGNRRKHHFYHLHKINSQVCRFESYLHYVAKNILFNELLARKNENKPFYCLLRKRKNIINGIGTILYYQYTNELSEYDILQSSISIDLEKKYGDYRPDICIEYIDKVPLFLEIKVTHSSTESKKQGNELVEINISKESDIELIKNSLIEPRDTFFNFDEHRVLIEEREKAKKNNDNNIQTEIDTIITINRDIHYFKMLYEKFLMNDLYADIEYCFDKVFSKKIRKLHTKVLLNDYYNKFEIMYDIKPYCILSNSDNKLIICYDDELKYLAEKYILLKNKVTYRYILDQSNIIESNMLFNLDNCESNYVLKVIYFIPKVSPMSYTKEISYKDLYSLCDKKDIELVNIILIRKNLTIAST